MGKKIFPYLSLSNLLVEHDYILSPFRTVFSDQRNASTVFYYSNVDNNVIYFVYTKVKSIINDKMLFAKVQWAEYVNGLGSPAYPK